MGKGGRDGLGDDGGGEDGGDECLGCEGEAKRLLMRSPDIRPFIDKADPPERSITPRYTARVCVCVFRLRRHPT